MVGIVSRAVMRLLKKLDNWVRDGFHCFLGFLEDRLAPLTFVVLIAVLILSILSWDSWSNGESRGTAIRNLVLVMGAIVALPLAIWRSKVAERQVETAQLGLLNERYQKSAEMLGNCDMQSVRLGGIYALDRLAVERSNDYYIQILKLFGAFVVDQTGSEVLGETVAEGKCERNEEQRVQQRTEPVLAQDVQEVMRLIAERDEERIALERKEEQRLNLSYATIVGFTLRKANFSNIDFTKANLSRIRVWDARFTGTIMPGANLAGADLLRADLRNVDMRRVNLTGASLIGADLRNANLGLVDLASEKLWGMRLFPTNLTRTRLYGADLRGAELGRANLTDAKLKGAKLAETDLSGANLTGAELIDCEGLTQEQINKAKAISANPPDLSGTIDANTGKPLVWRSKTTRA